MADFLSSLAERALEQTQTRDGVTNGLIGITNAPAEDTLRPVIAPLFSPEENDSRLSSDNLAAEIYTPYTLPSPLESNNINPSLVALDKFSALLNSPRRLDYDAEIHSEEAIREALDDRRDLARAPSPHQADPALSPRTEPHKAMIPTSRTAHHSEDGSMASSRDGVGYTHIGGTFSRPVAANVIEATSSMPKADVLPPSHTVADTGEDKTTERDIRIMDVPPSRRRFTPSRAEADLQDDHAPSPRPRLQPTIRVLTAERRAQDDDADISDVPLRPIQVSIGRIEIRATSTPPGPPSKPRPKGAMSLDEYLSRRRGGGA